MDILPENILDEELLQAFLILFDFNRTRSNEGRPDNLKLYQ